VYDVIGAHVDKNKLAQRKKEKAMRDVAALMQSLGVKSPAVKNIDIKEAVAEASTKTVSKHFEAEAVLSFLHKPSGWLLKLFNREECGQPFGTNYKSVGYCSDNCRSKDLAKSGIHWNPHKSPEERWGGEPPLLIPPEAILAMANLLRKSKNKRHRQIADDIQTQTEIENEGAELMSADEAQERLMQPIEAEAHAAVSPVIEPEFSDVQPVEQSELNPEYIHLEDAQMPEDSPATNSSPEQPQLQTVPAAPVVKSVFDF